MMFKLTPEVAIGAVAICLTLLGSGTATAIHWGSTNTKIADIQTAQIVQDKKLDEHQKELAAQQTQAGVVNQKLDDVIGRLDRIENEVTHGRK